jgi:membrane protease YdiL (CAAX protease family)
MLALIVVAIPVLATFTARRLQQPTVAMESKLARYGRIMLVLWAITALALFALRLYGQGPADVGLRPPNASFEYALGIMVAAMLIALSATRPDVGPNYARRISVVIPQTRAEWIVFIALAATAGICEEFLYRGFALTKIAALSGSLAAGVVFSSIAFGAAHVYQGRMGMIGAGLSGFLYALVFIASGSLIPCMLGHFTQDVLGAALLSRRLAKVA